MEQRQIIINNQIIPYYVHYKNIKKCYLRVKEGKIVISTSPYFTTKQMEQMILDNWSAIQTQLLAYEPKVQYHDGGYIMIMGAKYKIRVQDTGLKKCVMKDDTIIVYHQDVQGILEKHCAKILKLYLMNKISYYLDTCFDFQIKAVKIKKLKSRWGSCMPTRAQLTFNYYLIHVEPQLIDYVIVHELCHMLQANHSPAFYKEIEKVLPDYKKRIQALKKETI